MDGGSALCDEPGSESDLHSNPVWLAELAIGSGGYRGGVGNNHLDDGRNLEALQMGCCGSSTLSGLGLDCQYPATVDHNLELGQMILRLPQKLSTKIKAGKPSEMLLVESPQVLGH